MDISPNRLKKFHSSYYVTPGCWIWKSAKPSVGGGYGRFCADYVRDGAHRFSYRIHKGEIPKGVEVRHKCDNPACVNPEHLELGTHSDNMKDMVQRGRHRTGEGNRRLTEDSVRLIKKALAQGVKASVITRHCKVDESTIAFIKKGITWQNVK